MSAISFKKMNKSERLRRKSDPISPIRGKVTGQKDAAESILATSPAFKHGQ